MKNVVITCLLLVSVLCNGQQLKKFIIENAESHVESVILSPKKGVKYAPHAKMELFTLKDKDSYFKIVNQTVRKVFPFNKIPEELKKAILTIFFNPNGQVTYYEILINKKILDYTTEEEWEMFTRELKKINLLPYVQLEKSGGQAYYMMGIGIVNDSELKERGVIL